MARAARSERVAFEALERFGLLLLQDAAFPSLAATIAGARVAGSWWSHPQGGAIFRAAEALEASRDVLVAKLLDGKVTFVHRRLAPAVIAVGLAREPWQTRGLSRAARALLARVAAEGRVRATGAAAKQLERALLAASESVHTESGKHVTELIAWPVVARARGIRPAADAAGARTFLESRVRALNAERGARARLPWERRGSALARE